ncbi:hypothetical protein PFX98_21340 [Paucibacter sediminis]|uniref:Flagellar hook-length control protein FliK n=1 Tax=Paucibacter sediminis TaxID=3019553 RepID=A0AA95NFL5_9BURK|nr:hypothetical protein [Paucibacter sp. S2-9]WIT11414.1 hypothetical protein PFX98_21340 [Paucibacter sp. S2-9]
MASSITPIPALPALPALSPAAARAARPAALPIEVIAPIAAEPMDAAMLTAMRVETLHEQPDAATEAARWQAQLLDGRLALSMAAALPQQGLRFMATPQAPWRWPRDRDEAHAGGAAQEDPSLALGLLLDGEPVLVLLHWQQGLWLQLGARSPATLQALRALVPAIATALAAVPLRLRRCWLVRLTRPMPTHAPASQPLALGHGAWLLRAAAEIAAVLRQREAGLSPANPAR